MSRILSALAVIAAILVGLYYLQPAQNEAPQTTEAQAPLETEPSTEHVPDPTLRQTAYGQVKGFEAPNTALAWFGVPYATPPIDELRWRAPRPPEKWTGVLQTTETAPPCLQLGSAVIAGLEGDGHTALGSEDCLYLNIQTPKDAKTLRPVMFWIHGGGNNSGRADGYPDARLVPDHNVVLVSVPYRLSAIGWFAHESLRATGDPTGNFGTLDLIQALTWVQENIAAFGGDPDNVTIFGESAGGRNVLSLLRAKSAAGLFHRAISQSGGTWGLTAEKAENFTDDANPGHPLSSNEIIAKLLIGDGTVSDRAAAKAFIAQTSAEDLASYLRDKDGGELLRAYKVNADAPSIRAPAVFADGLVLPVESPLKTFSDPNNYNVVPTILGTNRDEFKLYQFRNPRFVDINENDEPIVKNQMFYDRWSYYVSSAWKLTGADSLAETMSYGGSSEVYVYRFDWDEQATVGESQYSLLLGASHGMEISFVFGSFPNEGLAAVLYNQENAKSRTEVSETMMSYWAQFAHSGNPGTALKSDRPKWQAWDNVTGGPKMIVFDSEDDGGTNMSKERVTRDLLHDQLADDPVLATPQLKCQVLRALVERRLWTEEEVPSLLGGACVTP